MWLFDLLGLKRRTDSSTNLIGKWQLIRSEGKVQYDETSEMIFTNDGKLIYSIWDKEKEDTAIMNLVYKTQGNLLITDQPSSPRIEKTAFYFERNNILVLSHEGSVAWFQRV